MTENPLFKFHTQPGTFVKLPSGGDFYKNPPELSADGEIEVKAMNAVDELYFQNPDSLLNNESLFSVIQHCVPCIPNAKEILKPDMDILLIGLRIATYGNNMDVQTKCSECSNMSDRTIDLSQILAKTRSIEGESQVEIDMFKINIKPFTVYSQQKLNEIMVSISRLAHDLDRRSLATDTDAELITRLKSEMSENIKQSAMEIFSIASDSIVSVETPTGIVDDRKFINEWLSAIKAPDYKIIRDAVQALSAETVDRKIKYVCGECEHENYTEVQFDPANFFESN